MTIRRCGVDAATAPMGARVEEVPARGYAPALFERADGRPLNKAFSWRARRLRRVTPPRRPRSVLSDRRRGRHDHAIRLLLRAWIRVAVPADVDQPRQAEELLDALAGRRLVRAVGVEFEGDPAAVLARLQDGGRRGSGPAGPWTVPRRGYPMTRPSMS